MYPKLITVLQHAIMKYAYITYNLNLRRVKNSSQQELGRSLQ